MGMTLSVLVYKYLNPSNIPLTSRGIIIFGGVISTGALITAFAAPILLSSLLGNNCQFSNESLSSNRCKAILVAWPLCSLADTAVAIVANRFFKPLQTNTNGATAPGAFRVALEAATGASNRGTAIPQRQQYVMEQIENRINDEGVEEIDESENSAVPPVEATLISLAQVPAYAYVQNSRDQAEQLLNLMNTLMIQTNNLTPEQYISQCRRDLEKAYPDVEKHIEDSAQEIREHIQTQIETLDPIRQEKIQTIIRQTELIIRPSIIKTVLLNLEKSFQIEHPIHLLIAQYKLEALLKLKEDLTELVKAALVPKEEREKWIELIKTNRELLSTLEEKAQGANAPACWTTTNWKAQDDYLKTLYESLLTINEVMDSHSKMSKIVSQITPPIQAKNPLP